MNHPLVPEWFGCGNKLEYFETVELDRNCDRSVSHKQSVDCKRIEVAGRGFATSVDKIYDVGTSSIEFARLALKHAMADVSCGGAKSVAVDVCFEFSRNSSVEEREQLSKSVFEQAHCLNLSVGKCHSTYGPITALTIAVLGVVSDNVNQSRTALSSSGEIIISGRLGGLWELYLNAMDGPSSGLEAFLDSNRKVDLAATADICGRHAMCSDVSGFGLWGAADTLSRRYGLQLTIALESVEFFSELSSRFETPCLLSDIEMSKIDPEIPEEWVSALLTREICGPLIFCVDTGLSDELIDELRAAGWSGAKKIGYYRKLRGVREVICQ